jgi:prevent-host-death family protein
MKTVGSYEAKTHLARLLDEAQNGEVIAITRHGKVVARIMPPEDVGPDPVEAIARLRSARTGLRLDADVRELIEHGRR